MFAELTYQLDAGTYAQAVAFNRAMDGAYFLAVAGELLVLVTMVRWRIGPGLRDMAERATRRRFLQTPILAPAVVIGLRLVLLPLDIDRHRLAVRFGQSVEAWPGWLADWTKELAMEALGVTLAAWILFALIRRFPERWWFYAWLISLPVAAAMTWISPLAIEPLFYHFQPLTVTHPALVKDLQAVAARAGYAVSPDRIFEMRAAEKTTSVNAYMTGFGATRRIVIWDTTIAALTPAEIQSVFAHELGHYALHHVAASIALGWLLVAGGFFAADRLLRVLIRKNWGRWRLRGLDDIAVLPLALGVLVLFWFLADPLVNGYSRWQERQADIYELEVMHTLVPDAGRLSAEVDQIMGRIDLADPNPNPLLQFWLYTHPATGDRMRFAQRYDAWTGGRRPRYVR
ncbi:MAG: M48 family metallopeptidase [Bryobacteraceae bacterium]